jgi:hypothetical protein
VASQAPARHGWRGKSHTIQAAVDGGVVLTGGCYEYEATTPYLPFVEAFRRWVREQKEDSTLRRVLGDEAAQIAKLAPDSSKVCFA